MNELFGQVFSIAKKHPPVEGCTISKSVNQRENAIFYFSLAENTDSVPKSSCITSLSMF